MNNALNGKLGFKGEQGFSAYEVAVQNGFIGSEKDWLATLGTSSKFERDITNYETGEENTGEFVLPESYTSNSFIDIYVEGERLASNEYAIDVENKKIILAHSLSVVGTRVEVVVLTIRTNDLPIIENTIIASEDNVLSAKTIVNDLYNNYIIDEITVGKHHHEASNTDFYLAHIPHTDKEGNIIKLKRGFAHDVESSDVKADETVRSFANRHKATLCFNAGVFNVENLTPVGVIVHNGVLMSSQGNPTVNNEVLGIKDDNTLVPYKYNVESATIIGSGCKESVVAFNHLLIDGVRQTINIEDDYRYQWNILAQNTTTKDFYLFVCDGKGINGTEGMTIPEALDIIEELGCDYAFRLDQGGSTSLIYKGEMINVKSDDNGYTEREVGDFLYFAKETKTEDGNELAYIYKKIGDLKEAIRDLELDLFNKKSINSDRLTLTPTSNQSASLVVNKDGADRCSIVLDHPAQPLSFGIWDYVNNRTSFRAGSDGYITTPLGQYGFFPKYVPLNNNIDSLNTTTVVYCQNTAKNSPYTDKHSFILNFAIGTGTANMCQIAIPMSSALEGNLTVKVRNRTQVNGTWTWGDWYKLTAGGK